MSSEDDAGDGPLPRNVTTFFGHAAAEKTFLDSYKSGRMPHAWLIGGEHGIGKATLAYRVARFVFAHPDPLATAVQEASALAVPENHPVARRITAQAQNGLLVLERTLNDKGKLRQEIAVEQVRRTTSFFGATAGQDEWRIAIVDSVDELNRSGANALLKVLEEPPARTLLLLISHAPGQVLPTIRSRCRFLLLRPLSDAEVIQAVTAVTGRDSDDAEVAAAVSAADGSVARALALLDPQALALRQRMTALLEQLPAPDPRALHALGDSLGGSDPILLANFTDMVNDWLSRQLHGAVDSGTRSLAQINRLAQAREAVNRAARDVDAYNLERKPLVFSVFNALAEAMRA